MPMPCYGISQERDKYRARGTKKVPAGRHAVCEWLGVYVPTCTARHLPSKDEYLDGVFCRLISYHIPPPLGPHVLSTTRVAAIMCLPPRTPAVPCLYLSRFYLYLSVFYLYHGLLLALMAREGLAEDNCSMPEAITPSPPPPAGLSAFSLTQCTAVYRAKSVAVNCQTSNLNS